MIKKPTYEELEQRIRELEIKLSGYNRSEGIPRGQPHEPEPTLDAASLKKERIQVSS